jgi:hypothetical protein
MTQTIDRARLTLILNDLRLPAIKQSWPDFAERSDKEGLRATSVGVSSPDRLSATISRFCAVVQERRRSPRVMTSTRLPRALLRSIVSASSGDEA